MIYKIMDGRELAKQELQVLIEQSSAMSETTHPEIFPIYQKICAAAGIIDPPRILVSAYLPGAYANRKHDAILIGDSYLEYGCESPKEQKCLLAHELGHMLRGHELSTPKTEREADSLMVMLTGEAQPYIDFLTRNKESNNAFLQTRKNAPMSERFLMSMRRWGQKRLQNKLYGPFEDRIAHLKKLETLPKDSIELQYWQNMVNEAVQSYNVSKANDISKT